MRRRSRQSKPEAIIKLKPKNKILAKIKKTLKASDQAKLSKIEKLIQQL